VDCIIRSRGRGAHCLSGATTDQSDEARWLRERTIPPEQFFTAGIDQFRAISLSETEVWKMTKERIIDSLLIGKHRRLIVIESYCCYISEQTATDRRPAKQSIRVTHGVAIRRILTREIPQPMLILPCDSKNIVNIGNDGH
jgi:hypothetical protein